MTVCRYHGARKPETIRKGASHPQYRHGRETYEAKAAQHTMSVFFHEVEELMFSLNMIVAETEGFEPSIPVVGMVP